MRIPPNAIIAEDKITGYLLVPRTKDDKSKFLAQAGFTQENPHALRTAIERLVAIEDAVEDGVSEYGTFYRVEGEIVNLDQPITSTQSLMVVTVWLYAKADNTFRFITLKPKR